jgi:hypothetical protein
VNFVYRIIILILLLIFSGCAVTEWRQPKKAFHHLPFIFDKYNIIGKGIKYDQDGYLPKLCLDDFRTEVRGGELSIEFHRVDSSFNSYNPSITYFVKKNLEKSKQFNVLKNQFVSFLLIIKITDRQSTIIEESARFRADVAEIIKSGNVHKFFDTCGTDFIHSITFDSYIYFFITYYFPPTSRSRIEEIIGKRISKYSQDSLQIKIFNEIDFSTNTFFSLQVETDTAFEPVEFVFSRIHGKTVDDFLNNVIQSVLKSKTGYIKKYYTMPWTKLGISKSLSSDLDIMDASLSSPEMIFKSLHSMQRSIAIYNYRLAGIRDGAAYEKVKDDRVHIDACRDALENQKKSINWQAFYKCYEKAYRNHSADLYKIPECKLILDGINSYSTDKDCERILSRNLVAPASSGKKTLFPFLLRHNKLRDSSIYGEDYNYRFDDKIQYEELPGTIEFGQAMERSGKVISNRCIERKTMKFSDDDSSNVIINNECYPYKEKKQSAWKRFLLFWKKQEPQGRLYRGSFEITGYSKRLLPNFKISDSTKGLAQNNLSDFYTRCGTHYISQVKHRRGFVYYFSPDESRAKDIRVFPYGMSRKKEVKGIPGEYTEDLAGVMPGRDKLGCCFPMPLDFSKLFTKEAASPLLEPRTVREFFKNRGEIIDLLEDDSNAVPVSIYLEPWSEYLIANNILRPDQLDRYKSPDDIISEYYKQIILGMRPDKAIYTGEYKDGMRHGRGELIEKDGSRYSGQWYRDKMHGYGVYTWANGDRYEGQWGNGKRNGKGVYTWINGDRYDGGWENDKKNGYGIYTWANGDRYEGQWMNGVRSGRGTFTGAQGYRYTGEYRDNLPHGEGTVVWPSGAQYQGNWENGLRHGRGTFISNDGDKYVGEYKNGKRHGEGIIYHRDGSIERVMYKNGVYFKGE